MMKFKFLLLIPVVSVLVGCTTHKELTYSFITTDSAPVQVGDVNSQSQLAETAVAVGHSLQEDSAIQLATHPDTRLSSPLNPDAIGMSAQTSLDWTGPIEPLLQRIASASHYRLRVLGAAPPIPVLVAINARNEPLADILRNATYQVVNKANISVYPESRTIELRYYTS